MAADDEAIRELVALLNSHDTSEAEDAEAGLKPYGAAILPPLLEAVPSFGRFGQLCAIELLQDAGDPRAATVLIPMLRSEHDAVRWWAASALGDLQIEDAVPEMRRAYEEVKQRGTPLDWMEPEARQPTRPLVSVLGTMARHAHPTGDARLGTRLVALLAGTGGSRETRRARSRAAGRHARQHRRNPFLDERGRQVANCRRQTL